MSLTKKNLKSFEEKLKNLKKQLELKLKGFEKKPEMGSDVDHFEEEGDEAEEFANELGIVKAMKEQLEEIEDALGKISRDSYGRCENCGEEIDSKLLEVNPESKYCKNCKLSGIE